MTHFFEVATSVVDEYGCYHKTGSTLFKKLKNAHKYLDALIAQDKPYCVRVADTHFTDPVCGVFRIAGIRFKTDDGKEMERRLRISLCEFAD